MRVVICSEFGELGKFDLNFSAGRGRGAIQLNERKNYFLAFPKQKGACWFLTSLTVGVVGGTGRQCLAFTMQGDFSMSDITISDTWDTQRKNAKICHQHP